MMSRARLGGAIVLILASCTPPAPLVATAPAGLPETAIHSHSQAPADGDELVVFLAAGRDPATYARDHHLVHLRAFRSDPDAHVFRAADAPAAKRHRDAAAADPAVRKAYLSRRSGHVKMPFTPNDAYYLNNTPPTFPGQWQLGGTGHPTIHHANCAAAWLRDVTGTGVVIGIVDDCLETAHPDLAPNYDAADSWDFGQDDNDPNPVYASPEDRHGTSVAGVAAARGGNTTGVTGAAPFASVAGLRVDFNVGTDQMFADATLYHSSGGNTTVKVKNHSYGYNWPYITTQLERDALATSAAAGTIHCLAAGNWRGQVAEDSNKLDLQSSPDAITVAALGSNGKYSSYSCFGANVFVASPSNTFDGIGIAGITTTDRVGNNGYNTPSQDPFPDADYTSFFGGTSSASPLAAGVMALVKQVQPALNARFAKHLLARHSAMVDPNDATVTGGGDGVTPGSAWKTNAAGFKFNQNYGFGRIDADALTLALPLYVGPSALQTETKSKTVNTAIPNNNAVGLTHTFAITGTTPMEEMLVNVVITHTFTGDLELVLSSPLGTTCRLAKSTTADNSSGTLVWTFSSNAFWGEVPTGTWTLVVKDIGTGGTGTWNNFSATARMGRLMEVPPVVSSVNRVSATPTNASSVSWTVTFSKSVTGVDATDFKVTMTGVTGASVTNVTGAGATWTVTAGTGTGDGTLRLDVLDDDSIKDLQGNPLNGAYSSGQLYTIDKTPPAVTSVTSTTGNGAYGAGAAINITVNFGESVTLAGGNLQVTLDTTDVVAIAPFTGTTASGTYTVGAGDNSNDLNSLSPLTLSAGTLRDAAGNPCVLTIPAGQNLAALKAIVVDTTPPTVALSCPLPDPTNTSPFPVTVTFSEPVVNFVAGDIVPTNGTVGAFAGGPTVYTFNLTPSGQGIVAAAVAAGVATDPAGNANTAAPGFARIYDSIAPTVTGVSSTTPDGTYGIGQQVAVTVSFSEAVNVVGGPPQLTLETGAIDAVVAMSGGTGTTTLTFPYTVATGHQTPDLDGVSLALNGATIRDPAGNNATLTLPAGSLAANKNIAIANTHPPADPADLMQRKADGATALALGGTTDEGVVVLSATISDPDAAQPVALQVEVRPTGTAFTTATATGALWSSSVTASGLANGGKHWRARAVDSLGVAGNWVVFGADPAFTVALPATNAAPSLSALGQFRSGGPFPIAVGGTTDETTLVFKAQLSDPEGAATRLEIEIKPVGTALNGTATAVSSYSSPSVTVTGLAPGSWHWGARAVDAAGAASAQVAFGGNPDFVISLAGHPAPDVPTALAQHDFVGASAAAAGFVDDDRWQYFSATLPPSGPLSTLKLQVEVQPVGTAFANAPTTEDGVLGLADGAYHWQARTADSSGLFSAWVSFGGNAEAAPDFSVLAAANAPPLLTAGSIAQLKGDGATAIPAGGTTVEPLVVLRAAATDADRWKLQVELRPNATPFANVPTAESGLGAATVAVAGLASAAYHWQLRLVDERGAASAWTPAGGNPDFTVNLAGNAAPTMSGAGQFRADGTTAIAGNGTTSEGVVIVKATVASGDAGQAVRLRVELRPNATPFTGAATATGAWGATQVALGGLVDGTAYHWQAWAEDASGGASTPAPFPGDPDFTKTANAAPNAASAPAQLHLDSSPLAVGATTPEGGALFTATLTDPGSDALRIQVELQPVGTAFANSPSATGAGAQVVIAGLPDLANFHWQCRAIDPSGAVSASWTAFGGNADPGDTDFGTDAGFVPPPVVLLSGSHDSRCPFSASGGSGALLMLVMVALAGLVRPVR